MFHTLAGSSILKRVSQGILPDDSIATFAQELKNPCVSKNLELLANLRLNVAVILIHQRQILNEPFIKLR
jgi:hypothetical protein